jgi:hypothetical protein
MTFYILRSGIDVSVVRSIVRAAQGHGDTHEHEQSIRLTDSVRGEQFY